MVRAAGAREVHLRISCPPTISPCFYGVDTPSRSELIAATHTLEEIREFVEADSLAYLSLEGLLRAVGDGQRLVLHVVLHRRLPGRVPARRAGVPAARAESRRVNRRRSSLRAASLLAGCPRRPRGSRTDASRPSAPFSSRPPSTTSASSMRRRGRRRPARSAARRAAQAVPALIEAVAGHADGYVRFRALVLLSGFNDPRARDVMSTSLDDPNDRLRAVAYAYFEHNPERGDGGAPAEGARQGRIGVRPSGADPRARRVRRPIRRSQTR